MWLRWSWSWRTVKLELTTVKLEIHDGEDGSYQMAKVKTDGVKLKRKSYWVKEDVKRTHEIVLLDCGDGIDVNSAYEECDRWAD